MTLRGRRSAAGRLGALAAPGLRTLVIALLPVGVAFGAVEVTIPAFAEDHGSASAAGVLLALFGVGSMVGGLWYGVRRFTTTLEGRFVLVLVYLTVLLVPLAFTSSFVAMGIAIFAAGVPIAPAFSASYTLIDRLAPPGTNTEAFMLTTTAIVVGVALGNAAAGALVDPIGTSWTFAAAAAVAALAPLSAVARRRTLAPVPAA